MTQYSKLKRMVLKIVFHLPPLCLVNKQGSQIVLWLMETDEEDKDFLRSLGLILYHQCTVWSESTTFFQTKKGCC